MATVFLMSKGILVLSLLCGIYRLAKGPRMLDRILAFDYLCVCVIALIALRSTRYPTVRYLEEILIFSLFGFATVICFMEVFFAMKRDKKYE